VLEQFHPFALSLLMGLIIGAEREYHHKKSAAAFGVRTFPFIALAGTLAAYLQNLYLTIAVTAVVFSLIVLSYSRSTAKRNRDVDFGLTTEFAALIVFCAGYAMFTNARLGALIALATLALLVSREWLHRFIRNQLKRNEITAATMLLIAVFGVAPFLPDRAIDPWQLVNPRRLVSLMALIGLIHFAGYAAIRIFGAKAGLALTGFLGGLISSTSVFLRLRETLTENRSHDNAVIASGLLAVVATLGELLAVLAVASRPMLLAVWLPLTTGIGVSLALAFLLLRNDTSKRRGNTAATPLDFVAVLKLGALLSLLIALVEVGHRIFAAAGLWIVTFTSGLFEMHGAVLAVSVEHSKGAIDLQAARAAILLAVAASFVSKIGITIVVGRDAFTLKTCALLLLVSLCGAATLLFSL
jgi:uncharacterized membrane protein (DUF4010 family)